MVTVCASWRGHKFEPRYSKKFPKTITEASGLTLAGLDGLKDQIYERDICVRCGQVIERKDG